MPKPEKDKREPMLRRDLVNVGAAMGINEGSHMSNRAKTISVDMGKAADTCEASIEMFDAVLMRVIASENKVMAASRQASSNIRKAANEIGEGVQRLEKMANFALLEQRVALLERAAAAIRVLADLEREGKLAKVMQAFKP